MDFSASAPQGAYGAILTPHEFREALDMLFDGWDLPLAILLDLNRRTVQRWAAGQYEIPQNAAEIMRELVALKRRWLASKPD